MIRRPVSVLIKLCLALMLLVACSTSTPAVTAPERPAVASKPVPRKPVLKPSEHSSVKLEMAANGLRAGCSGTAIGPHAIATAAHCVDAASFAEDGQPIPALAITYLTFGDWLLAGDPKARMKPAFVAWVDYEADTAELFTVDPLPEFVRMHCSRLQSDTLIHSWHHGGEKRWAHNEGLLSFYAREGTDAEDGTPKTLWWILGTLPVVPGSSGAGVFDSEGRMVGTVTGIYRKPIDETGIMYTMIASTFSRPQCTI